MRRVVSLPVMACMLSAWGCGEGVAATGRAELTETQASAVLGGEDSPPGPEDAVVHIFADRQSLCTGTLIAPNVVLTARHCVARTTSNQGDCQPGGVKPRFGATLAPNTIAVYKGNQSRIYGDLTSDVAVDAVLTDGSDEVCGHDVALLRLARPLDDLPTLALRLDGPPQVGERATFVGFGVSSSDGEMPAVRQRRGGLTVESYDPLTAVTYGIGGPGIVSTDGGPCSSDSGGPLISERTGAVIGLLTAFSVTNSAGPSATPDCEKATAFYAAVVDHRSFIYSALKEAGYAPRREGRPDPGVLGADCTTFEDCHSQTCVVSSGGGVCSQACNNGSCSDGFACRGASGGEYCLPIDRFGSGKDSGWCSVPQAHSTAPVRTPMWVFGALLLFGLCRRALHGRGR